MFSVRSPFFRTASALALMILLSACGDPPSGPPPMGGGTPQVNVMTLQPQRLPLTAELSGRVAAAVSAEVRPQVTGLIAGMIVVFAPLSVGAFIHVIYGADHPHAGVIAVAYLSLTGVATCIGLLNMWCQRGNLIYAELIANAARFAAVGAVCYFVDDPLRMIVSSAAIYPIIELALFVFLAFHGSRRK